MSTATQNIHKYYNINIEKQYEVKSNRNGSNSHKQLLCFSNWKELMYISRPTQNTIPSVLSKRHTCDYVWMGYLYWFEHTVQLHSHETVYFAVRYYSSLLFGAAATHAKLVMFVFFFGAPVG